MSSSGVLKQPTFCVLKQPTFCVLKQLTLHDLAHRRDRKSEWASRTQRPIRRNVQCSCQRIEEKECKFDDRSKSIQGRWEIYSLGETKTAVETVTFVPAQARVRFDRGGWCQIAYSKHCKLEENGQIILDDIHLFDVTSPNGPVEIHHKTDLAIGHRTIIAKTGTSDMAMGTKRTSDIIPVSFSNPRRSWMPLVSIRRPIVSWPSRLAYRDLVRARDPKHIQYFLGRVFVYHPPTNLRPTLVRIIGWEEADAKRVDNRPPLIGHGQQEYTDSKSKIVNVVHKCRTRVPRSVWVEYVSTRQVWLDSPRCLVLNFDWLNDTRPSDSLPRTEWSVMAKWLDDSDLKHVQLQIGKTIYSSLWPDNADLSTE